MLSWLALNWGTIVVCIVLIAVVVLIIRGIRKDKKAGKSLCGGNCKHCGGACHSWDYDENRPLVCMKGVLF